MRVDIKVFWNNSIDLHLSHGYHSLYLHKITKVRQDSYWTRLNPLCKMLDEALAKFNIVFLLPNIFHSGGDQVQITVLLYQDANHLDFRFY